MHTNLKEGWAGWRKKEDANQALLNLVYRPYLLSLLILVLPIFFLNFIKHHIYHIYDWVFVVLSFCRVIQILRSKDVEFEWLNCSFLCVCLSSSLNYSYRTNILLSVCIVNLCVCTIIHLKSVYYKIYSIQTFYTCVCCKWLWKLFINKFEKA